MYEDSEVGLDSNVAVKCSKCNFILPFSSNEKLNKQSTINLQFVCGMRVIRRVYSSAKKLCATLNIPCVTKGAYRLCEKKLLAPVTSTAKDGMNDATFQVLKALGINAGYYTLLDYKSFNIIRVSDSKRHSLPRSKSARKKIGPKERKNLIKYQSLKV
ncbi:uncharacterized protein TNCV_355471 [Trichonephila clavipes]|uniref:Mutator-like transposase domain-containing protein n=1 Tax=Trichonephila clavipes TaxID=2585209 RepID=A0A8X6W1R0_TRICX|nr:uncharacterized protein TNCV_355471 [Trichonephila clavipes]